MHAVRHALTAVAGAGALLALATAPPALAAGHASLVAHPPTVAFGAVGVGQTATSTVTVANSGNATTPQPLHAAVTGTGYTIATDACSGHVLAAGASCGIAVRYKPTAVAAQSGKLTVTAGSVKADPVGLTGRGVAAAALAMTPAAEAFATTSTGSRSDIVAFTVTNTGGATAGPITTSRPGADFAVFVDGCSGVALAPHAECSYQVAFTPQGGGARTGTLAATATPGGSARAALSGTGLAGARLALSGPSTYPDTAVGAQSAVTTYSVTNDGDQPSGPIAVAALATADFTIVADHCSGQSLPAGAACAIDLRFVPQAVGPATDVLSVNATPGGGVSRPIAGTGLGVPDLSVSPGLFLFPDTAVFTSTFVQVFRVTNDGTAPAYFDTVTAVSNVTAAVSRELAPEACQHLQELDPGQSCNVAGSLMPLLRGVFGGVGGWLAVRWRADPAASSDTDVEVDAYLLAKSP